MYKLPNLLDSNASLTVNYELDLILAYDALVIFKEVLQSVANFGTDIDTVWQSSLDSKDRLLANQKKDLESMLQG
jgi:hypothetical protein